MHLYIIRTLLSSIYFLPSFHNYNQNSGYGDTWTDVSFVPPPQKKIKKIVADAAANEGTLISTPSAL